MTTNINEINDSIPLENVLEQLDDIVIHKQYVYEAFRKMSRYFIKQGRVDVALKLMNRCFSHDQSKLREKEFMGMAKFSDDKSSMTDMNVSHPAEGKMEAIRQHWLANSHHPEYWDQGLENMSTYDIIEMVCDWYARTMQFDNDLLDWVAIKCIGNDRRWEFSGEQIVRIVHYATLLSIKEEAWDHLQFMAID